MRNRSLVKRMSRMLLAAMVAVLALGIALPAEAHHKDRKQNKRLNKLENKTSELSTDGSLYEGAFWAFNGLNTNCVHDDDARFYQIDDLNLFFLDCESFQAESQSVDAQTTNGAVARGLRLQELRDIIADLP